MSLFYQSTPHRTRIFILLSFLFFISSISAQTVSKRSEIYDYQVGDIFHYELTAYEFSSGSHVFTNIEIMGKYYSVLQDTLFYIRSFAQHENHSWAPDWAFSKRTDTTFVVQLDSLINSGNIDTVFTDTVFNGRKVNRFSSSGTYSNTLQIFVEGCGLTYSHYEQISPDTDREYRLIYYKKGSEVWGIPIPLSVRQAQNTLSLLKIFPNPSMGVINIEAPKELIEFEIRVFDISGDLIFNVKNKRKIDLSKETNGVYYIQLITNESSVVRKVVLQN